MDTVSESAAGVPFRLGGYELLSVIDEGSTATVYRARRTGPHGFERTVAVKVLHPHLRRRSDAVARFYREARLGAKLRHPNVVPVLDIGPADAAPFMVMEWVDGTNVARLANRNPLPPPLVGRIMTDALRGLHALHEVLDDHGAPLGLVHRDFSTSNLLIGTDGLTRLGDLGISRVPAKRLTVSGVVHGTVPFLSPEQCRAEAIDRRSDVWSAGAVIFELLCGTPIVATSVPAAVSVAQIAAGDYPSLARALPEAPLDVVETIDRALATDPTKRWPTAAALGRALAAAFERNEPLATHDEVGAVVALSNRARPPETVSASEAFFTSSAPAPRPAIGSIDRHRRSSPTRTAVTAASLVLFGAGAVFWGLDRWHRTGSAPATSPLEAATAAAPDVLPPPQATAATTLPVELDASTVQPKSTRPPRPRRPNKATDLSSTAAGAEPSPPPLAPNPYANTNDIE